MNTNIQQDNSLQQVQQEFESENKIKCICTPQNKKFCKMFNNKNNMCISKQQLMKSRFPVSPRQSEQNPQTQDDKENLNEHQRKIKYYRSIDYDIINKIDKNQQEEEEKQKCSILQECIVCFENFPAPYYTKCCKQPLHVTCNANLGKCPYCRKENHSLCKKVLSMSRAIKQDLNEKEQELLIKLEKDKKIKLDDELDKRNLIIQQITNLEIQISEKKKYLRPYQLKKTAQEIDILHECNQIHSIDNFEWISIKEMEQQRKKKQDLGKLSDCHVFQDNRKQNKKRSCLSCYDVLNKNWEIKQLQKEIEVQSQVIKDRQFQIKIKTEELLKCTEN